MNDLTFETKQSIRRDRAIWQKAAIGMLGLAVAGNVALGGVCLSQHRYMASLETAYEYSETTREAAITACGRLAQRCQELEAEIALGAEQMHVVVPVEAVEPTPYSRYAAVTADEREMLARLVWLEARGESAEGQQAVAEVVLNRVAADNFPDSVEDVIFQKRQFAPAARIPNAEPGEAQYQAVDAALYGVPVLPMDVVYFSRKGENDNVWGTIGGHVFCYQYDWEAENG